MPSVARQLSEDPDTETLPAMAVSEHKHLSVQDIPARRLSKCRLQLREYRREQSNALCQRFLSHVLLVPSCPHKVPGHLPLWLACVSEPDGAVSARVGSDAWCQPQPHTMAAFDRKDIMSGCSGGVLVDLRENLIPKLLPYAASRGHTWEDLLQRQSVWATPPQLDVPMMEVPFKKVFSLLTRQAYVAPAHIPDQPTLRTEAVYQFLGEAGIRPKQLPLPDFPWHAPPSSQLKALQPIWQRAPTPGLLEPALLAARDQHGSRVQGPFVAGPLLSALSADCSAAALPEEDQQTSLAQIWSADVFVEQTFATKLGFQPLQALPEEEHATLPLNGTMAVQSAQHFSCELPKVLMCPRPDGRVVSQGMLSSMMAPLPLPEAARDDITLGLTLHDLVGPGQVLCDEYPSLPLVQVMDRSAEDMAALHTPIKLAQGLQARPVSLAAAELLLDWSLIDPTAPDPSRRIQQVREQLKQAFKPQALQQPEALPPLSHWQELLQQLTGPPVPERGRLRSAERLQAAMQRVSQQHSRHLECRERLPPSAHSKPSADSASKAQLQGGRGVASGVVQGQAVKVGAHSGEGARIETVRASEGEQSRGVFCKAHKRPRRASREGAGDAAFFMGLQRGASEAASEASGSSDDSLGDGFHGEPEVEHKLINMPDTHVGILSLIHQTCRDVLCSTPGANRAVAPADPSDSRMLEKAMTSAAELERRIPGSQRILLKAYSGIAVLRQSGHLLLCYGVRCAHLHLKHCMQELPGLYAACRKVVTALQRAHAEVEAGQLQDHPKLATLNEVLTTVLAIQPGGKVLLIAESRAYFTVYRTITDTTMRPYQLDRDGGHQSAVLSREDAGHFKEVTEAALQHADCILAEEEHILSPDFPLSSFCCLVRYVHGTSAERPQVQAVLQRAPCARIVLFEVDMAKLFREQRTDASAALYTAPAPGSPLIPSQSHPPPGNKAAVDHTRVIAASSSGHDGQPAAPSRHAPSGTQHAQPAASGEEAAASWSLAVTTRKNSPVRARRSLYEALLRLEAQSAAVVDRQLRGEDIALSADTCCCIWTEDSLKGSDAASLLREKLRVQLVQVAAAYSTCLLCLEGSAAFELSVMSSVDELIALACRCGVALSIITAGSPAELERALVATMLEFCQCSQGLPWQPLAEAPSSRAAFLEAFPCLNPFSAATLACHPCSLQQLLHKPLGELETLARGVPQRSLKLFLCQAAWGEAVHGVRAAGRLPPDLPDPLLADAAMHAGADLEAPLLQQHAPQAWPAQRDVMHPQQGPHLAQEQTSVHSDSSEWIHDGVADGASNLEAPCEGVTPAASGWPEHTRRMPGHFVPEQHVQHADWEQYLDSDLHSRHITTPVAGQRHPPSRQRPWASSGHQQWQGAPPNEVRCEAAVPQHARSRIPKHLPAHIPAHLPEQLPDDLTLRAEPWYGAMHEPDAAFPATIEQPQQPWPHDGPAMPAREPAWVPVRGREPYGGYPVQQHQRPQAYSSAPRPMQHPQGRAARVSYVSVPGRQPESPQQGHALGRPGEAPELDRPLYASHQGEPWQAPAWQCPEASPHPVCRAGQSFPEAHADGPQCLGRRQHASMEAMHAGGMHRPAGIAGREAVGLPSKYPPGADEFGVSFDPLLDLGSPAAEELVQDSLPGQQQMVQGSLHALHAGAQDMMSRPLRQGRGGAMQPAPLGRDFDAGAVLERFLQRRAGVSSSYRKRPEPSPARSQQSLGRAPKRPAFALMPQGFHAPPADSGDASDEGETMMLDTRESPALATSFRKPKFLAFGRPSRGQSKLVWKDSRRAL